MPQPGAPVSRQPERLALTEYEPVRLTLKTPYRDGTTHIMFNRIFGHLSAVGPRSRGPNKRKRPR